VSIGDFRGLAIECCLSNFTPTDPCCDGNEIWDKMGYNSAYVQDIFEILASNKGVLGVKQINNFSKYTMADSRCHGNKICGIWPKIG